MASDRPDGAETEEFSPQATTRVLPPDDLTGPRPEPVVSGPADDGPSPFSDTGATPVRTSRARETTPGDAPPVAEERELIAALSHPNTVRIYDHGTTEDGLWYFAMELLEGRDLSTIVREEGPMSPARAVHLVRQAARALAEAHAAGIVHRDIKPENLFVATLGGERDFIKVLDFGIARAAQVRDSRLTTTGWVAGTPAYVSPEAARGESADAPADVYGLGMVLYWAVAGTLPFIAATPFEMLAKQVGEDAAALAVALDEVAAELPLRPSGP